MSTLRDVSIKRKLMLIIMLTSVIALTLACTGFIIGEAFTFRDSMARNLSTTADVIGANSTAALVFKDRASAEEILSALGAVKSIVAAGIYTKDGLVFARYLRRDVAKDQSLPVHPEDGYRFEGGHLLFFRPIIYDGERIGTVYLQSDMQELTTRVKLYVGIVALVLLASSIAAYLLSSKLQRVVSDPISQLAKTMRIVSGEKDYSVRVTKHGQDEIGVLIDGFNDMLAQIQTRDAALQSAHNELEKRVQERTKSLEQANAALRNQIQERKQAEEDRARLLKEVQDSHARLQYLSRRMLEVQEEERRRIARELHDETGQSLTSLLLGLRMLGEMSTSEAAQARVEDLRKIAARALDEVKRLAMGLRPALLDDLGLEAALKRLAEDSGKTHGIFVDLHMNGLNKRRMAFPVETTIYRIVQEALTNAGRHAAARNVSILLTGSESSVKLIIEDDGRGFDVENTLRLSDSAKHLGLLGMHERVALLHGTFSVESTPGSGTTIYVQLPLEAQPS